MTQRRKLTGGKKPGRPSIYTQKLGTEICDRLAAGESLRAICRDEGMPHEATVRAWAIDEVPGFFTQYARARLILAFTWADEIIDIANTPQIGVKTVEKPAGTETTHGDMIEHRRLQVDTRKWLLSKVLPKVYGDKVIADITADITNHGEPAATPLQLAREIAFALTVAMRAQEAEASASEETDTSTTGRDRGHQKRS